MVIQSDQHNQAESDMSIMIDEILTLLNTKAEGQYGLSNVTQKQHALQCAMLAEQALSLIHI